MERTFLPVLFVKNTSLTEEGVIKNCIQEKKLQFSYPKKISSYFLGKSLSGVAFSQGSYQCTGWSGSECNQCLKMKFNPTPESAIAFVKASVFLVCSWPPKAGATKLEFLRFRIRWWFVFVLLVTLFLPLLNGVWIFRHDSVIAIKGVLMATATIQALIKIIVCRCQRDNLQVLHEQMEIFLQNARPFERHILERYVQRCSKLYGFVIICVYLACFGFILEPLILPQPFPTDSAFPFPVEFHPVYEMIYIQQSIAIFHIAAALAIDSQVAMLFWYISARFEMLGQEMENAYNEIHLQRCIMVHQNILADASKITGATRLIVLATVTTTTIGIICGGLTLISYQPMSVKLRVGNMVLNASVELFVYAWPADHLIQMSCAIGNRAYNCLWHGNSNSMQKSVVNVIRRSQKPVTISVSGFLPTLSLYYYSSVLSSAFSYFTTLRRVYNNE